MRPPHKISALRVVPREILDAIIEHVVLAVGIQKAVLLRTVNRAFDAALLHAICTSQVVDIYDSATPDLCSRMDPHLRGKILLNKSRADSHSHKYIQVVAQVNHALDELLGEPNLQTLQARHELIAGSVILEETAAVTTLVEQQNLLSGAATIGKIAILKSLLEYDPTSSPVDINGTTAYFPSALTSAAAQGHPDVLRYLLRLGASPEVECKHWRQVEGFQELADWNKDPSEQSRMTKLSEARCSPLQAAVRNGHTEIARVLLQPEYRLPVNSLEYLRALLAAARAGRVELVHLLLKTIGKQLCEFEAFDREMLWEAVRGGHINVISMLLDDGLDVNSMPVGDWRPVRGALHLAASLGNLDVVRYLLKRGADVNLSYRDWVGCLPIVGAAQCGQEEVVDILIECGADAEMALHGAARGGQARLVKYLLDRFPELACASIIRNTFWTALALGDLTSITILVDAGMPLVNGTDSPIASAKKWDLPWVVAHLMALGLQDNDDTTPTRTSGIKARGIWISERTWNWVGKY